MALDFWKIAMRPGKPLMFGRLGAIARAGPAGQPGLGARLRRACSWCRCCARCSGRPDATPEPAAARAGAALEANGPRQHYMRATSNAGADGMPVVTALRSQDSSLLSPLAHADCLWCAPPKAPARCRGRAWCAILPLDFTEAARCALCPRLLYLAEHRGNR